MKAASGRVREGVVVWLALAAVSALVLAVPVSSRARSRKAVIEGTMPAVVMVMAVDVVDETLEPVGSGSGTIVGSEGSVLTNHHVIHNGKESRLYDMFVIGRFRAADREPELVSAGRPSRAKLKPKFDLALIKCDMDMNGQFFTPSFWPSIPVGRSEEIVPGEQVWVLGYPNVCGSTIHVTAGLVSGWTGERRGAGSRAFMKTDAAITHGNSGGTATDANGRLIGVPTAFRVTTEQQGAQAATVGKVGLIRPIEHARDLIALARRGWTPKDGEHAVPADADRGHLESREDRGVTVTSKVVDAANRTPISGAVVIVFKPGIEAADLKGPMLGEQALSWGQTNAGGVFSVSQPIPRGRSYSVAVLAPGYRSMTSDGSLAVGGDAPDLFDPWGEIRLERE